jgi:hypothetical protein
MIPDNQPQLGVIPIMKPTNEGLLLGGLIAELSPKGNITNIHALIHGQILTRAYQSNGQQLTFLAN